MMINNFCVVFELPFLQAILRYRIRYNPIIGSNS